MIRQQSQTHTAAASTNASPTSSSTRLSPPKKLFLSPLTARHVSPWCRRKRNARKKLQVLEKKWITNFHLMYSQNNERYPKLLRELFESPIVLTPEGNLK